MPAWQHDAMITDVRHILRCGRHYAAIEVVDVFVIIVMWGIDMDIVHGIVAMGVAKKPDESFGRRCAGEIHQEFTARIHMVAGAGGVNMQRATIVECVISTLEVFERHHRIGGGMEKSHRM